MPTYTQSISNAANTAGTNFAISTSVAGTGTTLATANTLTMSYTTGNVGDLVVFTSCGCSPQATVTSVSATNWVKVVAYNPAGSFFNFGANAIWMGQVTAAAVTDVITVSGVKSGSSFDGVRNYLAVQQFRSATPSCTWTAGTVASFGTQTTAASWPWQVPAGLPLNGAANGFLYVGVDFTGFLASYTPGSGYTSVITSNSGDNSTMLTTCNPGITTAATPAAITVSPASDIVQVGVYIGAYPIVSGATTANLNVTPVPMGKSWGLSQIGFECLPVTAVTTSVATVLLNGRLLFGNTNANGGYIQGPPYVTMSAGDALSVMVTGLPTSTNVIINLYYNEYVAGEVPNASNTV